MQKQRIVYKYPVGRIPQGRSLNIPAYFPNDEEGSVIIKIGLDGANEICAWVSHPFPFRGRTDSIELMMFPTGINFNAEGLYHVETVVDRSGLVWHYYEVS